MIVDCAYYSRGVREPQQLSLEEAAARPRRGNNFAWIELREPAVEVMKSLCNLFDLHELAVEDALRAHQRPKVEAYDDFHFIVYKAARYDEGSKRVRFGELDVFLGRGFVIAVRHGEAPAPDRARALLDEYPQLVHGGPAAVVWAILDTVVDDYRPVVDGLEGDLEELERATFARRDDLIEQVYLLKGELNDLYRAVHPLLDPLAAVERGGFPGIDPGLLRYFRDVADHVRRIQEEVLAQRDALTNVLEAHLSLINLRQSEIAADQTRTVNRLTLVATVFLPLTFITGFFGQNFGWLVRHMDTWADFVVLGIGGLVVPVVVLYAWFRRGGYV
jgi:magnesium transporter